MRVCDKGTYPRNNTYKE